jgi:Fic/DOC family
MLYTTDLILMPSGQKELYISIVSAALLNKYQDASPSEVARLVSTTFDADANSSEIDLIAQLRPIENFADDVNNQVALLMLIELYWSIPPKLEEPLVTLNKASFGLKTEPVLRSVDEVEDFGGKVPVSYKEISPRLDELETLCKHTLHHLRESPPREKALMLAYIYGSIIRIHPFADGNGRTARLFVFYALRCWGLPLFPIPKVRNNQAWKSAMEKALTGEISELTRQLLMRISP